MSRKSSWWLRPQRKGASNRAALNEAKYFMEHNKVLQKRINELAAENAKLRELVATAIRVQTVLCGNADSLYCRNECPLHRPESNDCLACDVIEVAQELRVEVVE